jgi:hypothetical protein
MENGPVTAAAYSTCAAFGTAAGTSAGGAGAAGGRVMDPVPVAASSAYRAMAAA